MVASGLAAGAGVAILAAQVSVGFVVPSWRVVVSGVAGLIVALVIPFVGAALLARRQPEGVAVVVAAAVLGLPAILAAGYLLVSSPPPADATLYVLLNLAAQLMIAGAGIAAWGLRDADRWRWDRPVPLPFVALAIVVVMPIVALLVTMHGTFFFVEMIARLDLFDLSILAQLLITVGLLVWSARLPRRTAAVVLLVLLVPRLFASLDTLVTSSEFGTMTSDPFTALGLAAEAVLIVTICWWLGRDDDVPTEPDVVATEPDVTR
jgi:peptidoglycan/LPS O-acetylase OafA/YrhL